MYIYRIVFFFFLFYKDSKDIIKNQELEFGPEMNIILQKSKDCPNTVIRHFFPMTLDCATEALN